VSGCAAEVSQRIAEAVFAALTKAIPDLLFAAPAGTSGNLGVGGYDPERNRNYIMYLFTGGGYGGFQGGDGLSNGCSTIGISKMPPVEVLEQFYPVLFEEFSLREGSGGAGEFRGGFGINYAIKLRRGEARVSMVMDHGRTGPQGVWAARRRRQHVEVTRAARPTGRRISPRTRTSRSASATWCACQTPGGGGFGDPASASPSRSRATSRAATTARPRPARSSAPAMIPAPSLLGRGCVAAPSLPAAAEAAAPTKWYAVRGRRERLHGRDAGHSGLIAS
jgi:N-methylhydantoinase B